jgi:hypothetical protein
MQKRSITNTSKVRGKARIPCPRGLLEAINDFQELANTVIGIGISVWQPHVEFPGDAAVQERTLDIQVMDLYLLLTSYSEGNSNRSEIDHRAICLEVVDVSAL